MTPPDSTPPQRDDARDQARLRLVAAALDGAGVRWWVDHGTLLGLVREGRPLPWDDDLDVSLEHDDLPRAVAAIVAVKADLAARLVVTRRGVKVHPHEPGGRVLDVAPYRDVGDDMLEKTFVRVAQGRDTARRGVRVLGRAVLRHLDAALAGLDRWVWSRHAWSPVPARVLIALAGWPAAVRERIGRHEPSRVPSDLLRPGGSVAWDALQLPAPLAVEAYLAFRYGDDWRTPRRAWTWWDDDKTVPRTTRA